MRKRKANKTKATIRAEQEMELLLKKVGYKGGLKGKSIYDIPNYSTNKKDLTSDKIPTIGKKNQLQKYTGQEILGIAQLHKSSSEPIRRDNKEAAVAAAQMRRN